MMKDADGWIKVAMQLFADYPFLWLVAVVIAVVVLGAVVKLIAKHWPKRWDPGWDIQNRNTPRGRPVDTADKWSIR